VCQKSVEAQSISNQFLAKKDAWEKQQRLGQDAAATDRGLSGADSPVVKVKTLTVNRRLGQSMRM
jgi:hypothetical protein